MRRDRKITDKKRFAYLADNHLAVVAQAVNKYTVVNCETSAIIGQAYTTPEAAIDVMIRARASKLPDCQCCGHPVILTEGATGAHILLCVNGCFRRVIVSDTPKGICRAYMAESKKRKRQAARQL